MDPTYVGPDGQDTPDSPDKSSSPVRPEGVTALTLPSSESFGPVGVINEYEDVSVDTYLTNNTLIEPEGAKVSWIYIRYLILKKYSFFYVVWLYIYIYMALTLIGSLQCSFLALLCFPFSAQPKYHNHNTNTTLSNTLSFTLSNSTHTCILTLIYIHTHIHIGGRTPPHGWFRHDGSTVQPIPRQ